MGEAVSWVAVNNCGEFSLDSDLPPLPRGWERCLDLQSGIMYLKEMHTQAEGKKGVNLNSRVGAKRQRVMLDDEEGEGNPALQLTLSLRTSADNKNQLNAGNQIYLSDADSLGDDDGRKSLSQKWMQAAQWGEDAIQASSNGSSASHNAYSPSVSSPPPPFKLNQWRSHVDKEKSRPKLPMREKTLIRAVGCPHCFMYVLPSKNNPKCPRCKSSILVDLSPLTIH